ncbi:hypothetical protein KY366_01210 [Candidatus Woesearchaeota archaeon]|nr:hypothetical protein [Candidatus Woesearchaeota archaeon]
MKFLISICLLLFSTVVIIGIWNVGISRAEDPVSELLCRNFNAARTKTKVKVLDFNVINTVPRTCKTLEKEVPSEDYLEKEDKSLQAAMLEMSDLAARCWWMWLEGIEDDMFGTRWFGDDKCFICYTFDIKKDVDPFQASLFKKFLDDRVYITEDTSDMCNVNGGGWCREKCEDDERQIPSTRCPEEEIDGEIKQQLCCNKKVECINKGGICEDKCDSNYKEYPGWSCRGGEGEKCCIEKEDFLTYTGYVQSYMGEGAIIVSVDEFQPSKETYALSFISKTSNFGDLRRFFGNDVPYPEDAVNLIMVSKLKDVEKICSIEADVSGE